LWLFQISQYPTVAAAQPFLSPQIEEEMKLVLDVAFAVRGLKSSNQIKLKEVVQVSVTCSENDAKVLKRYVQIATQLLGTNN
jgi:valyl-tRNA synthetase